MYEIEIEVLQKELEKQLPAKRLKFLRQKIIRKNQSEFCNDGIIREGTLKSIESEKIKISPKIAERLAHKMRLEGIICKHDLFLEQNFCDIWFNDTKKIVQNSGSTLEDIRKKLSTLTPINIHEGLCPSIAPNGATALARELKEDDLTNLSNTLCLVHGAKMFVSFLTYENNQIRSECNGKVEYFPTNIIQFCGMYAIEILYFNP